MTHKTRVFWFLVRRTGLPLVARELLHRRKATIILYHDPEPETFTTHMRFVSKHYRLITVEQLVSAIEERDWRRIPAKSLVVTFDDGHCGNFRLLSIFKEYGVRPTIYLCSQIVDTSRHFWWTTPPHDETEALKRMPIDKMLDRLLKTANHWPQREYSDRQALNLTELKAMGATVDFGSHGRFHLVLDRCRDETSLEEIAESKKRLGRLLGRKINHFSYPNGDYSDREVAYLKKCGYRSARTCDWGWTTLRSDPFRLRIVETSDDASVDKLCAQLSGCFRAIEWLMTHCRRRRKDGKPVRQVAINRTAVSASTIDGGPTGESRMVHRQDNP